MPQGMRPYLYALDLGINDILISIKAYTGATMIMHVLCSITRWIRATHNTTRWREKLSIHPCVPFQ